MVPMLFTDTKRIKNVIENLIRSPRAGNFVNAVNGISNIHDNDFSGTHSAEFRPWPGGCRPAAFSNARACLRLGINPAGSSPRVFSRIFLTIKSTSASRFRLFFYGDRHRREAIENFSFSTILSGSAARSILLKTRITGMLPVLSRSRFSSS